MGPLTFDPALTICTVVTFAGLFLLLARFTFKPLRKILDEREERIRGSLEEAKAAREEAQRILGENARRLDEAREETRRIIAEGHRIVANMKLEAEERAREEADQTVKQARAEIDRELRKSLDELKGTVAGLSVRISRQIIRGSLDEKRHEELAEDFIERLKKTHAVK
jgi:F-type H+-transporting ATPase subunit b